MKKTICITFALLLVSAPHAGAEDRNAELVQAASDGKAEIIRELCASGADVNARDANGYTALMKAARSGHIEAARLLFARNEMYFLDGGKALRIPYQGVTTCGRIR